MTMQEKEIINRIDYLEEMIMADYALGCGCVPPNAHADVEEEIQCLRDELAKLRGFKDYQEMYFTENEYYMPEEEFPF